MTNKEQLIKEFRERFTREDGLLDIGKYDDEIVEDIIRSAFDAGRASGIEEMKELRRLHANCGWGFTANEYNEKIDEAIKALTASSSKDN